MEVLKVIEKSLETPPVVVPRPVLMTLEKKMGDYFESVAGRGPTPMPTRDDPAAAEVRGLSRVAFKKWGNLSKAFKSADGVPATRLMTFLKCPELKAFEDAWHAFAHAAPKLIDRSTDEAQSIEDFANEETARRQKANDVDQAKKEVEALRDRYPKDVANSLFKGATEGRKAEMKDIAERYRAAQKKGEENWFDTLKAAQDQVKWLDTVQDEATFGEQRRQNRERFALRLTRLGDAIDKLAAGKLGKELLEVRKAAMRKRLDALSKLVSQKQPDPTWEPQPAELRELVEVWSEVYACRNDTGEVAAPEPAITVQHAPKIDGVKNKWSAWADKVLEIDNAFTSGLLDFSSDMKLTGNPGCRFHKQGDCWKFYLDEAEMGGSTTMRGWYRPQKTATGVKVTFIAISDSHSGPTEKVLYGEV